VEVRILGPLEAVDDGGRTLPLGGRRPRSIMATLVVEANRMVSTDRLVEEVWGSNAPRSAVATLQSYLSRLRHALEPGLASNATPGRLVTHQAGYELRADTSEIDARRFEALAAAGRAAAAGGDDPTAVRRLAEALELWRGPVLDGLDPGPTVRGEVSRLTELRLGVVEERLRSSWRWATTPTWSASSRRSWRRIRCVSACTRCGCSPCTARAGRPTRSRRSARRAVRW
jgi:DNA-binding SARP family transcriptional activator